MTKIKYYLDQRAVPEQTPAPLKLRITHKGKVAFYDMAFKILPRQWDKQRERVVAHPKQKIINFTLDKIKERATLQLFEMKHRGKLEKMTAKDIRDSIDPNLLEEREQKQKEQLLLLKRMEQYAQTRNAKSTQSIYQNTIKKIREFQNQNEEITFDGITQDWLQRFDLWLEKKAPSRNARNLHFRNIRAVFNQAIEEGITTHYPFRKFKIKPQTTRKRALSLQQLRELFNAPLQGAEKKHRDIFLLMFLLMGINIGDLCKLKQINPQGRVEFHRAKTKRFYSMLVEPEAREIIDTYHGKNFLIDILDHNQDYRSYYRHLNHALKRIGANKKTQGKGIIPDISTYSARHSWATIAAELDIPKETIAAALGHGRETVTDIYIDFDRKKVDQANRKVIDFVLYDRR